jgi:hypothetical protein
MIKFCSKLIQDNSYGDLCRILFCWNDFCSNGSVDDGGCLGPKAVKGFKKSMEKSATEMKNEKQA